MEPQSKLGCNAQRRIGVGSYCCDNFATSRSHLIRELMSIRLADSDDPLHVSREDLVALLNDDLAVAKVIDGEVADSASLAVQNARNFGAIDE